MNIPALRLFNQHLSRPDFERPEEVVSWFGAVQAQDYGAAKWALGLRLSDASEARVEEAFAQGGFLRTHVLRPTWHFVLPEDIRWMLKLTSPRVHARNALYYRRLELESADFKRCEVALAKALQGGKFLTRAQMRGVLERAGIRGVDARFTLLIMHAELEGLICSGPREGKQFTYALLEERASQARRLDREESLAELSRRYLRSHGPATARDFSWWSGLAMAEAKRGIEMVANEFSHQVIAGQAYWFHEASPGKTSRRAWLLPNFDEYIVGYTERGDVFNLVYDEGRIPRDSMLSHHTILLDGQVAGTWTRTLARDSVLVEFSPFELLRKGEEGALRRAAKRYAAFLGLKPVIA
jgi:hypothetical protein